MGLLIAISFIISSFLIAFVAKKNKSEQTLNRFLLIAVGLGACISALFYGQVTLMHASFVFALASFYFAGLSSNKYATFIFESIAIAIPTAFAVISNVDIVYLIVVLLFLNLVYLLAKKHSNNIAYLCITFAPAALAGLYLNQDNPFYIITLMTFLGSIRFFIETKHKNITQMFSNTYILILFYLFISFNSADILVNSAVIFAGFAFAISAMIFTVITRHKHSIYKRMILTNSLEILPTLKVLGFNIFALVLAFIFKASFINLITLIIILTIALSIGYLKLWYIENEHKLK